MKTIELTLGKEYWNKGKFNFSKEDSEDLPHSPTNVILILGENEQLRAKGKFLFATSKGQPRVNGDSVLREWFQKNFKEGDKVKVEIIGPTEYKLY